MSETAPVIVGRYAMFEPIAAGGMAAVHLGRLVGPAGFSRTVAIKRLLRKDPSFVAMLLDEARLAGRVRHPNVVPVLDVVTHEGEVLIVLEYVHGESLSTLARAFAARGERIPVGIAVSIVVGALHGLHAAHEATSDHGEPLGIVHRDVSPQNILVGTDGVTRVTDFGIAKAVGRLQDTRTDEIKGKLAYLAPEQLSRAPLDRRVDVYAASVVLWELLAGKRLFLRESEAETMHAILFEPVEAAGASAELDEILVRGLDRAPAKRFPTALELALALEDAVALPREHEVGAWLVAASRDKLSLREQRLADIESRSVVLTVDDITAPAPRRRRAPVALAAAAGLIATGALVYGFAVRARVPTAADARPEPLRSLASSATLASELPSAASTADAAASASSAPSAAASATPPPVRTRTPPPARASAATAASVAAPVDCDPPYVVDSAGIKIPKRECVGR